MARKWKQPSSKQNDPTIEKVNIMTTPTTPPAFFIGPQLVSPETSSPGTPGPNGQTLPLPFHRHLGPYKIALGTRFFLPPDPKFIPGTELIVHIDTIMSPNGQPYPPQPTITLPQVTIQSASAPTLVIIPYQNNAKGIKGIVNDPGYDLYWEAKITGNTYAVGRSTYVFWT